VRPSPFLLILLLAWGMLGVLVALQHLPMMIWHGFGLALAVIAGIDALLLYRQRTPTIQRELPDSLALGVERQTWLEIDSLQRQRADIFDLVPDGWSSRGLPQRLFLPGLRKTRLSYHFTPTRRGNFSFEGVHVRLHSPLRLWRQQRMAGTEQTVRVYPNFAPLTKLALLSAEMASRVVGAHLKRRRGEGTDFHQMREYRQGDSLRQIDWKATSRARKLISREYQDEKNQQLLLLLDTGRRMLAFEHGLSHFDHVLNASLMVAWLALRQGDGVGLFASGEENTCWVAPQRGPSAIDALLRASYTLQAQPVATDYLGAAAQLIQHHSRRCLVILTTNVRDEDIEDLLAAVKLLQKRHLVCVASLRESELDQTLERPVTRFGDSLTVGAIAHYLHQRQRAHDVLRSHRVSILDVTAAQLPTALVEHYLAIKRAGAL